MFKKLPKNPIFYFCLFLMAYTVYDYFEHIRRPGSNFGDHPWYWLGFTVSALGSLFFTFWMVKKVLESVFKRKNMLFEVLGVAFWLTIYLNFLGPLINSIFWPFDELYFSFKFEPAFIIMAAFFLVRIVLNLVRRKPLLYSE